MIPKISRTESNLSIITSKSINRSKSHTAIFIQRESTLTLNSYLRSTITIAINQAKSKRRNLVTSSSREQITRSVVINSDLITSNNRVSRIVDKNSQRGRVHLTPKVFSTISNRRRITSERVERHKRYSAIIKNVPSALTLNDYFFNTVTISVEDTSQQILNLSPINHRSNLSLSVVISL